MAKMLTLGQASKMTGKSKPTRAKAVKDGRISGKKGKDGVFQIEVSELLRVYPAKSEEKSDPLVLTKDMGNAVAEIEKKFLPYQVNKKIFQVAKKNAVFMHCLPAERQKEVSSDVIDDVNISLVWDEAENRLHVQKAILEWCLNKI